MALQSINPVDGHLIKEYEEYSSTQIAGCIELAMSCYTNWKKTSFAARAALLGECSAVLLNMKEELGRLISLEMGKPIKESVAEIEKCAWVCRYYAEKGAEFLQPHPVESDAGESYICYEPLGALLAIMPWNFPFWQVFRFAVPAIMAGNVVLLKHASNVSGCSLAIADVFRKAGAPLGLFQALLISSESVEMVIGHPDVKAITLTGSERAGSAVAAQAGKLIKKTVMELGGSDPFIVLSDANLKMAAVTAVRSRFLNNGQSCIAAKRFIIHQDVLEEFVRHVTDEVGKLIVDDPLKENTDLGPMARADLAKDVLRQVSQSIDRGAVLAYGTVAMSDKGAFIKPIILTNARKGMPVYDEEVFGPVFPVIEAIDEEDCIRVANDTAYGLGATIWTKDLSKAKEMASGIEAGSVFINGMVKSDPRLPFGGVKMSGYGRELSEVGIREFVNIKTVWIG